MKKNFFFALLEEQLVWLKRAVSEEFSDSFSSCEEICRHRYKVLISRLFRDFMTPVERRDLYEISVGILNVFSSLYGVGTLSSRDQSLVLRSADLLIPLPFDERIVSLQEELDRIWSSSSSRSLSPCRLAFEALFRSVTVAALNHV